MFNFEETCIKKSRIASAALAEAPATISLVHGSHFPTPVGLRRDVRGSFARVRVHHDAALH
jgi:hypothetical protein